MTIVTNFPVIDIKKKSLRVMDTMDEDSGKGDIVGSFTTPTQQSAAEKPLKPAKDQREDLATELLG